MKSPSLLLEGQLQAQLHYPAASRTDQRIASHDVGRTAPAPKRYSVRGVVAGLTTIRCAVRIGDNGVIEQVKDLGPELSSVPLLVRECLEYREIHVLET